MPSTSTFSAILFTLLLHLVAFLVLGGFIRAGIRTPSIIAVLLAYLALPAALAWTGKLDQYDPPPAPALLLLACLTILTFVIVFSRFGARLASSLGLGAVVLLQAFRIPVELLLHRLYVEGVVPVQMTYEGRNFDVITGITGLLLGLWLTTGKRAPRAVVLAWNVLGLVLLANIVGVAVASTPVSFRQFTEGPPNLLPSTLPFIWLPSFLVQVALGSHLLVFRMLRSGKTAD